MALADERIDLNLSPSRRRELAWLVASFVGILVLSYRLAEVIGSGWQSQGTAWHLLYDGSRALGVSVDVPVVFIVGFFVGIVGLMWLDRMKRVQAFLLTIGAGIGFVGLTSVGIFEGVDWAAAVGALAFGALVGVTVGGGIRLVNGSAPYEFPNAPKTIFWFVTLIVVNGLFEYHVRAWPVPLFFVDGLPYIRPVEDVNIIMRGLGWNVVSGLALIGLLFLFTKYESRRSIAMLGPSRSGKSTLMTGLAVTIQEQARRRGANELPGNSELRRRARELGQAGEGFGDVDQTTEPDRAYPLELTYHHGTLFPRRVTIQTLDYAGEVVNDDLTERVNAYLDDVTGRFGFRSALGVPLLRSVRQPVFETYEEGELQNLSQDEVHDELAILLDDTETIILLLPLDEFVEGRLMGSEVEKLSPSYYSGSIQRETDYINVYEDVIDAFQSAGNDKNVILVATMCDLAVNAFEEWHEEYNFVEEDWEAFREFVTEQFLDGMALDNLWILASNEVVYPVYFEPNREKPEAEDGGINPIQPDGRINLRGADELLTELGRQ